MPRDNRNNGGGDQNATAPRQHSHVETIIGPSVRASELVEGHE